MRRGSPRSSPSKRRGRKSSRAVYSCSLTSLKTTAHENRKRSATLFEQHSSFHRGRETLNMADVTTLLEARNLRKSFAVGMGAFKTSARQAPAVDGVSFSVERGETLAIVGESGCGKTTLARMLMRLIEPDEGEIRFAEGGLMGARGNKLRSWRAKMQMVFQDLFSSRDPRMRVGAIVAEPLAIHFQELDRAGRAQRVAEAFAAVGLDSAAAGRYPHEFSGGDRQRVGVA